MSFQQYWNYPAQKLCSLLEIIDTNLVRVQLEIHNMYNSIKVQLERLVINKPQPITDI